MSWVYEQLYPDVRMAYRAKLKHSVKTDFQELKIFNNPVFGNMLMLDGVVQTTQMDEFIYHEMLTHPAIFSHPQAKDVLIIGAGDGGILREVLKHPVKRAVLVEIDGQVIEFSKKYLPSISDGAFSDKRAQIICQDGARYVKDNKNSFDVVIIDSPDPVGAAKVLFSKGFYKDIFESLKKKGVMIRQTGSTLLQPEELKENYKLLDKIFDSLIVRLAAVPTYVGGFFSLIMAGKGIDLNKASLAAIENRYKKIGLKTKYYNPQIHFASAVLPNYIRHSI